MRSLTATCCFVDSVTKGSLLASIVFILERKGFIDVDHAIVYFCVCLFFIYFRMMALLTSFR